mgnify:CR=1 FL=1
MASSGKGAEGGMGQAALGCASILGRDTIRVIAESIDIGDLPEEVGTALLSDVDYRLREIVQEAAKFMRHSKRTYMRAEDVNSALRVRNIEQTYGHGGLHTPAFESASGSDGLFFFDDAEIPLSDIIGGPLPPCPREPSLVAHWLAVEGVQPAVRQNPTLQEASRVLRLEQIAAGSAPAGGLAPFATGLTGGTAPAPSQIPSSSSGKRKRLPVDQAHIRPLVEHVLSEELQMYFETVCACLQSNKNVKNSVKGLREDSGIQPLMPYLTQFVFDEVTKNLQNLEYLKVLMKAVRALLQNENLNVEPYLHQLMPPILTCLVGKRLCVHPRENHWELRDYSAELVGLICTQYGKNYASLQARVTRTLLHAFLDLRKPLTTHYGSIVGLAALGLRVVQLLVVPNAKVYVTQILEPKRDKMDGSERKEADRVYHTLLSVCGRFLREMMTTSVAHATPAQGRVRAVLGEKDEVGVGVSGDLKSIAEEESDGQNALRNILPEDWLEYYVELRGVFGDDLSPFLPEGAEVGPGDPLLDALV